MERRYQFLLVDRFGPDCSVRLIKTVYDDIALDELGAELGRLLDEENIRHIILHLGPDEPECLYSVFLAKLISIRRRLERRGGVLALASLTPHAHEILAAIGLDRLFPKYADLDEALRQIGNR